jgi:endonuclease/exonuclease/phosphatase family metal-dependent hydrolase
VPSLRVATLNLWGRQGPWDQRREALKLALARAEIDVMGLQEAIHFDASAVPVSGGGPSWDQAAELGDSAGLYATFGAAMDLGFGYAFGNAILSRYAIRDVECEALPNEPGVEPRSLVSAIVDAPFGPVTFFSTHLSWRFDEGALRMRQVMAIARAVDRRRDSEGYPTILVGDFNAEPESDEIRFLRGLHTRDGVSTYFIDAFAEAGSGDGATFSHRNAFAAAVGEPDRRIDYVFVRGRDPRALGKPLRARVAFDEKLAATSSTDAVFPSDHFGVVADLRAPEVAKP